LTDESGALKSHLQLSVLTDDSYRGEVSGYAIAARVRGTSIDPGIAVVLWLGILEKTAKRKTRTALANGGYEADILHTYEFQDLPDDGPCLVFDGSLPLGFDSTLPRVGTESLRADRSDELALAFPEVPDDVPGFRDGRLIQSDAILWRDSAGVCPNLTSKVPKST
jgi:hypothetical protein